MSDLRFWVAFNIVQGIGPVGVQNLLDYFGGLEAAWQADPLEQARAGLGSRALENLRKAKAALDLDEELDKIARLEVKILTWESSDYPERLRHIYASPPVIYVKGELRPEDEWAVAVVGTRRASSYGKEVTRQIVTDLTRSGVTIVSGMAYGIDGQAHQAALDAGGRTLAVLGCGVDVVYPSEHRRLAQRIVEQGALISDYPLGTKPEGRNFPPRNRIISGLSLGVLVVEGGSRSGAYITAADAAEQGREVFAVPGNILNRTSALPNQLIQKGAKLVRQADDILEELNLTQISQHAEVRAVLPHSEEEALLLDCLSNEPRHVDEISRLIQLPIEQVTGTLTLMELKGMVRQIGGMRYAIMRESRAEYETQ